MVFPGTEEDEEAVPSKTTEDATLARVSVTDDTMDAAVETKSSARLVSTEGTGTITSKVGTRDGVIEADTGAEGEADTGTAADDRLEGVMEADAVNC